MTTNNCENDLNLITVSILNVSRFYDSEYPKLYLKISHRAVNTHCLGYKNQSML